MLAGTEFIEGQMPDLTPKIAIWPPIDSKIGRRVSNLNFNKCPEEPFLLSQNGFSGHLLKLRFEAH